MKKRKYTARLGAVLLAGTMGFMVSGCGSKDGLDVENIRKSGVLRIAVVDSLSAFTIIEEGLSEGKEPVGFEPDLASRIAESLGVTPQFQMYEKQDALAALTAGEADIALGGINDWEVLPDGYETSISYGKGYFYAVTREGEAVLTVGALENATVGIDAGLDSIARTDLYAAAGITVKDLSSVDSAMNQLENGSIRAYVCHEAQAKQCLENERLQIQNLSGLEPEEYVIAARKSDQTLVLGINDLISQYLESEK